MKKRILSMLLVVCMLMSMLPTAVFAATGDYSQSVSTYDELVAALADSAAGEIHLTANITADRQHPCKQDRTSCYLWR